MSTTASPPDKNRFDAALLPGVRAALSSGVAQLRQAEQDNFNALLTPEGEFLPGVAYVRDCPHCGTDHHQSPVLMHAHGMHLLRCSGCGLVYSREVITPEQERLRYQASSSALLHLAQKQSETYALLESEKARYVMGCLHEPAGGSGRLLDIGSSNGAVLQAASDLCWQALGVELNAGAVALCQAKGLNAIHGEYPAALPADTEPFDAIVMLDVLEHVADPLALLATVHRQLRDGGWLVVQVPNFDSLLIRLDGPRNSNICHGHWSYFNADSLAGLLATAGFSRHFLETYISELDRILAHPAEQVAALYAILTGQPLENPAALTPDALHEAMLGYKVFGIFRKTAL